MTVEQLVAQLTQSIEELSRQIGIVRQVVDDDRLDMREVRTLISAVQATGDRLERIVITGNGAESLKNAMARTTSEMGAVRSELRRLERLVKENHQELRADVRAVEERERKARAAVLAAALTTAGALATTLIQLFTSGSHQ